MKRPSISHLRHRVLLETAAGSDDGAGGQARTWQAVAELWASIEPAAGGESVAGEGLAGRVSHTLRIRHRPDVGPAQRFRFGARIFEIAAVLDPEERRRFLTCHCLERNL